MIRVSDNEAATAVHVRVGDAGLRRLARRAGMKAFAVSGYWGYAQITAADQARLFAGLNRLVPRRFLGYARGLLSSIVSSQSWGIPEVARPRWRTFFKGGWRGSARGQLVHQAARLERGGLAIAIAVLTDANPNHAYGRGTVRGIAAHLIRNGRRPQGTHISLRARVGNGSFRMIVGSPPPPSRTLTVGSARSGPYRVRESGRPTQDGCIGAARPS
jgi:Beta-lactamase enzyme family